MKVHTIKDVYGRPRVFRAEAVLELLQEQEFRLFGLSLTQIRTVITELENLTGKKVGDEQGYQDAKDEE